MKRLAIVTGANTGVGRQVALALASDPHNYRVVLACRDETKAAAAAEWIKQKTPSAETLVVPLDLADLVEQALAQLAPQALAQGLELSLEAPPALPAPGAWRGFVPPWNGSICKFDPSETWSCCFVRAPDDK